MIDIRKLIDEYANEVTIREKGDYFIVTPPFFHIGSDESIALKFSEAEDGRPVISDCGTTFDYLGINDIDIKKYRDKLNAVLERFYMTEDDGVLVMAVPSRDISKVRVFFGYFIQAISLIANIDL